jgi:hypothetical protein
MMARRQAGSEKAIIHNGWWPFHFLRAFVRQTSVCRRLIDAPLRERDKLKFVGH